MVNGRQRLGDWAKELQVRINQGERRSNGAVFEMKKEIPA